MCAYYYVHLYYPLLPTPYSLLPTTCYTDYYASLTLRVLTRCAYDIFMVFISPLLFSGSVMR